VKRIEALTRLWITAGVLVSAVAVSPSLAGHMHVDFPTLVHTSQVIVDGHIAHVRSRRDALGLIVTDITLDVLDVWHADARGHLGSRLTWTVPGGTVGAKTLSTGVAHFEPGERIVAFAMLDGQRWLDPFIGGDQGVFRVLEQGHNAPLPMRTDGRGIEHIADGNIFCSPIVDWFEADGTAVFRSPVGFAHGIAIGGGGAVVHDQVTAERGMLMDLSTFRSLVVEEAARQHAGADLTQRPAFLQQAVTNAHERVHRQGPLPATDAADQGAPHARGSNGDNLCYCGTQDLFIYLEMLDENHWAKPYDNMAMGYWNRYMDIFREAADDGTYGHDNDESEFCGFVANLPDDYDFSWPPTAMGVCFVMRSWWDDTCDAEAIIESDIVFNPAYTWTTDFDLSFEQDSDPVLYQSIVVHEVGHSWGYITGTCDETYAYGSPSVMFDYYDDIVEDGRGIHALDVWAVRDAYYPDADYEWITDLGVESYAVVNGALVNAEASALLYYAGSPITVEGLTIENLSINVTSGVRARLYLSTDREITTDDVQLPGWIDLEDMNPEIWWAGDFTSTIPDVPAGEYWIGAIISKSGNLYLQDDYPWNDRTWLPQQIVVLGTPPSNNNCAAAIDIDPGVVAFDTTYATTDGYAHLSCGDGGAHNDIWYSYIPPSHGTLLVSTCQAASFDTMLAVYRDEGVCPPLSGHLITCNDDNAGWNCGQTSFLAVDVEPFEPVLIRVGAATIIGTGDGELTTVFNASPPPNNDDCNEPLLIQAGQHNFNTVGATTDGLANLGTCSNNSQAFNDIWFSYTVMWDGELEVSTCDTADFDTILAVYEDTGVCPPPASDLLACNDDWDCRGLTSLLTLPVQAGQQLRIRVGGFNEPALGEGVLSVTETGSPPINDDCASGVLLADGDHFFDTTWATTDGVSHLGTCDVNGQVFNDIWFRYTAPCQGTLTLDTCGLAEFDTDLVVYDGAANCTPDDIDVLACNDSGPNCLHFSSTLIMPVTTGQSLLIRLGGFADDEIGAGTLRVSLEADLLNDACTDAIAVVGGTWPFDTTCATTDGVQHDVCQWDGQVHNDIWFSTVATCDGQLLASTCDMAAYDTDLAIYEDIGLCPPGDAQLLACNDDGSGCGGYTSLAVTEVTQGQPILIRVGGWGPADSGSGSLLLRCTSACQADVAPPGNPDGQIDIMDLLVIIERWGMVGDVADLDGDGVVNIGDLLAVMGAWGECPEP